MGFPPDSGDARFDELYGTYCPLVLAYALRRTEPPDAEDATSETFLIVWRRLADVPAGEGALPWLYATCRNVIANQRRGRRRVASLIDRLTGVRGEISDSGPHTEGGLASEALGRLSAGDQELLRLVAWEALTHAEIAQLLRVTPNAVAIRLHRARTRFREAYRVAQRENDLKGRGHIRTSVSAEGTVSSRTDRE